jgi:DNA repair protein RadC
MYICIFLKIEPMLEYKKTIKSLAEQDRPREKMLARGRSALTDSELIAILIRSGNSKESAVSLSQRILQDANNDLSMLAGFSVEKLMKYEGVGEAKALSIAAALELGRRKIESTVKKVNSISSSQHVYNYMQSVLSDIQHEEFWALFLNVKNQIISRVSIGQGGATNTIVDVKKIFRLGIEFNAVNIIVCHNHPSGNLTPSQPDIDLTKKILEAAKIMDMNLLDHIIIGRQGYFSFADKDLINKLNIIKK